MDAVSQLDLCSTIPLIRILLLLLDVDIRKLIKYYTDWHGVDEDSKSFAIQGGDWTGIDQAGVMDRTMDDLSVDIHFYVASLKNKNSLSRY